MKGNVLIRNTTVYTMGTRGVLEHADILIREGRIAIVGGAEIPPDTVEVMDGRSLIVTPGLIDVHTHMGACEEGYPEREASDNEMTEPATPQLRILDAVNPRDRAFRDARESGVTTVQILPGSGNVIGGECAILSTAGEDVEEMLLRAPSGMKVAFGENPKGVYGG
ncbi:MAG TPA: amidohydrolase, partial [Synergistaceae bacterium]|nr:amidohydrolase [Synergistaceae bacterium]